MNGEALRVVNWNLCLRVGDAAVREARLLRSLRLDLACLQEVNANSLEMIKEYAGFDWVRRAHPVGMDGPASRRSAYLSAVAGSERCSARLLRSLTVPFPERIVSVALLVGDRHLTVSSYHAPPGVSWGIQKVEQAVTYTQWLKKRKGPTLLGADANTPEVDAADFERTRTHWHTGQRRLEGKRGDDVLWGPDKDHQLRDALRVWLDDHPAKMKAIRQERPDGPLEVSHRTGVRKGSLGTPRRFDSIWVSGEFAVRRVRYLYEAALEAGSDHAVVIADLRMEP
jgi:endonuclease/exonuclease/phosphatase family metal-dependent hydrolase